MPSENQKLAWARFEAYRSNLPSSFDEHDEQQYHTLLSELETAFRTSLAAFRIPPSEMNPRVVAISMSPRHPTRYSRELYCDSEYVERQVEGVWRYLTALGVGGKPQDRTEKQGRPMVIRVGKMRDSIIQQGVEDSTAALNFQTHDGRLTNLLSQIRGSTDEINMSAGQRDELEIDLKTIDVQLSSRHPKSTIVMESLRSIRSILEGTTGSLLAAGILLEIGRIIGG